jgi:hypothetical protein
MPKLADTSVPSYRLHKQSGQAIVTLNGRDILLGRHGTIASKIEYRRRIAEWIANDRRCDDKNSGFTVTEMIAAFKSHAERHYCSRLPRLRGLNYGSSMETGVPLYATILSGSFSSATPVP